MTSSLRPLKGALCILAGIVCALCFVVSQQGYTGMSEWPASAASPLWTALAACFALGFFHVFVRKSLRPHWLGVVMGLLFGQLNAFCSVLFAVDSWQMGKLQLLLTLMKGVCQALPMIAFFTWLDDALRMRRSCHLPRWFEQHPVAWTMLILIVCWSPYLIAFFPGTVCWDLGEMVAQFFGQTEMDTWHPVFTTWLIGGCVWLGRLVGSDNLGAALFTLLQTAALSYALARAVDFIRRRGAGKWMVWASLAFFSLVPLWGGYAQFISKDTLYTACLLLFALCVLDALVLRRIRAAEWFVWGLLSCLLRSNGLYVVAPTALVLIAFGLRGRDRIRMGASALAAVCGAVMFSSVLIPSLGIRDETASGLYSVCFQQSARVLRDHEVTQEEYAEIDLVLDAENLPDLYEPWISDPVKFTFRQYGQGAEAEKAALSRYRDTWLSMMTRYPLSYLEAFFAGNMSYYTFQPKIEGETFNNQAGNRLVFETYELGDSRGPDPRFLDTTQIPALEGVRQLLAMFARGWRYLPAAGMLYACAVYTWTLVGCAAGVWRQKRWRVLIAFVPALLSLGVCMLGPVNDYFRYFLPIAAMTLPLVAAAQSEEA